MMEAASSDATTDAAADPGADPGAEIFAGGIRSVAIRYAIMMPKLKGAAIFQPEDHVSEKNIKNAWAKALPRFVGMAHTGSIFLSGTVLFVAHEQALRRIEPETKGDMRKASATSMALGGACGGLSYAVCATGTATWLGTASTSSSTISSSPWHFFRTAIRYTAVRDGAGFAVYFGSFRLAQEQLTSWLGAAIGDDDLEPVDMQTATPARVAGSIAVTAISGALSGLATYLVRSPFDTLYKQAIGWRPPDAPLWSFQRFLSSPRGLKSLGIGAITWSAYEVADVTLRAYAARYAPSK